MPLLCSHQVKPKLEPWCPCLLTAPWRGEVHELGPGHHPPQACFQCCQAPSPRRHHTSLHRALCRLLVPASASCSILVGPSSSPAQRPQFSLFRAQATRPPLGRSFSNLPPTALLGSRATFYLLTSGPARVRGLCECLRGPASTWKPAGARSPGQPLLANRHSSVALRRSERTSEDSVSWRTRGSPLNRRPQRAGGGPAVRLGGRPSGPPANRPGAEMQVQLKHQAALDRPTARRP